MIQRQKIFVLSLLAVLVSPGIWSNAAAQDINFKDLSRRGTPVVRNYTVTGVADDGREYLAQFDGVDAARVQARREAMAAAPPPSSAPTQSSKPAASPVPSGPKEFICEFYCKGRWSTVSRRITSGSLKEAAQYAGSIAWQVCGESGRAATNHEFSERQCRPR